jgi:hypothetical protein
MRVFGWGCFVVDAMVLRGSPAPPSRQREEKVCGWVWMRTPSRDCHCTGAGGGFQKVMGHALEIIGPRILQEACHFLVEGALIAFECQNIVGLGVGDFRGDLLLATHGIDGHDAVSTSSRSTSLRASACRTARP